MNIPKNLENVNVVIYGNGGGIANHKENAHIVPYPLHTEVLNDYFKDPVWGTNPALRYHVYDGRINRHVWMLVADRSGFEQQFVKFLYLDVDPFGTLIRPTLSVQECQKAVDTITALWTFIQERPVERQLSSTELQIGKVLLVTGTLEQRRKALLDLGVVRLSHIHDEDEAMMDRMLALIDALAAR